MRLILLNETVINLPEPLPSNSVLFLTSPKVSLISSTEYRNQILQHMGSQILFDFQTNVKKVFLTSSFNFKKVGNVIHCVLPKYSENFINSSLDSLHFTYRELFEICLENNLKTLVIGEDVINPKFENGYNVNNSFDIFLRTIRKILEKFYLNFDKIIFAIKNEDVIKRLLFYFRVYFPRNSEEENISMKYLQNYPIGEFGDLIRNYHIPKISEHIEDKKGFDTNTLYNYNDLNGLTFMQSSMYEDSDRIAMVYDDNLYFSKKYYYKNLKSFSKEIKDKMEDLGFLQYKGTDMEQRQIFFLYMKLINFEIFEGMKIENLLLIFFYEFFKENFQKDKKFSMIFFCNGLEKKNLPSKDLLEIIQKIIESLEALQIVNFKNMEIIFFAPDFFFKMFINMLMIFFKKEIRDCVRTIETYDEINEIYCFELDEQNEKRIDDRLLVNRNFFFDIKEILDA
ncbi:MAG: hypothetical protein MJ252_07230, partial [archaeon]|nr:hypothetical protein [archaeon]